MNVRDIMTESVKIVHVDDTVETCAKLLIENLLSGLPVLNENGALVGIVTEGDVIKRASRIKVPAAVELLGGLIYLDSPKKFMTEVKQAMSNHVGELMTQTLVTVQPDDTIEQAATIMIEKNVKRLPVVNVEGKLVGIVSRRDIMRYLYIES